MYYDGQADWSDSDWFGGLGEPMSGAFAEFVLWERFHAGAWVQL